MSHAHSNNTEKEIQLEYHVVKLVSKETAVNLQDPKKREQKPHTRLCLPFFSFFFFSVHINNHIYSNIVK